jgi:hypothetical protein
MLSGVEWRNCDTCPRRFAVLHGVIRHTCPDCECDKKAMERRSAERQRWHTEKQTEAARKGGRPRKHNPSEKGILQSAARGRSAKGRFGCPNVTENPPINPVFAMHQRRKKRPSRSTPLVWRLSAWNRLLLRKSRNGDRTKTRPSSAQVNAGPGPAESSTSCRRRGRDYRTVC